MFKSLCVIGAFLAVCSVLCGILAVVVSANSLHDGLTMAFIAGGLAAVAGLIASVLQAAEQAAYNKARK